MFYHFLLGGRDQHPKVAAQGLIPPCAEVTTEDLQTCISTYVPCRTGQGLKKTDQFGFQRMKAVNGKPGGQQVDKQKDRQIGPLLLFQLWLMIHSREAVLLC